MASGHPRDASSAAELEPRLRWRLLENPRRGERSPGDCGRAEDDGRIVGSMLFTPTAFRFGAQPVMGLLGGGFFVAKEARGGWGRRIFERFVAAPGCDFAYSTSCNEVSSSIWRRHGDVVPRAGDRELLVPLSLRPIVAELAARRPTALRVALDAASAAAEPIWRLLGRGGAAPALAPCRDWERLAAVAERERDPTVLVADLSVPVLEWRYAAYPARERIANAWAEPSPPRVFQRHFERSPVYAGGNGATGRAWAQRLQISVGDGDRPE